MNLPPGTYMTCPACRGEPLQLSHETKSESVTYRATLCTWCNGSGRVPVTPERPPKNSAQEKP